MASHPADIQNRDVQFCQIRAEVDAGGVAANELVLLPGQGISGLVHLHPGGDACPLAQPADGLVVASCLCQILLSSIIYIYNE